MPELGDPFISEDGVLLASVADLVKIKLTSFRLRDQVHLKDMLGAHLITRGLETSLSPELRQRLEQVRAAR